MARTRGEVKRRRGGRQARAGRPATAPVTATKLPLADQVADPGFVNPLSRVAPWWAHRDLPDAPWVKHFRDACVRTAGNPLALKRLWAPVTITWPDVPFAELIAHHMGDFRGLWSRRQHGEIRDLVLTLTVEAGLLPEAMRPMHRPRGRRPGRPALISEADLRELARQTRELIRLLRAAPDGPDLVTRFPMFSAQEVASLRRHRKSAQGPGGPGNDFRDELRPRKIGPVSWLLARRGLGTPASLQRRLDSLPRGGRWRCP